jgi:hypothetical protein
MQQQMYISAIEKRPVGNSVIWLKNAGLNPLISLRPGDWSGWEACPVITNLRFTNFQIYRLESHTNFDSADSFPVYLHQS